MSKPIGAAGLALIKNWEGCRLKAYKPVPTEKYWTIGWGHYGPDVKEGQVITQAEADAMLVVDCQRFADAVDNPLYCPLTTQLNANQRDALISFTFNCGAGCLRTLCKGRTLPQICKAMALYDKSNGKPLAGLTRRRKAEQALFNTPIEEDDLDIEKLTDAQLIRLAERLQAALAKRPISAALSAEVEEAVALGITDGSGPNKFCTRAQCAAMVKRAVAGK
ncbi:lysozyme [Dysosmobacter sp.]|uniref:lysozyme n=1 Tax=Dysosmobacter sp. TaxID=2591382 RepID=UPI002A9481E6|nr:lysozyme [Dysosmobacter sp.]MDY5612765.1 lysozyme [Dysosmobacter sp.]